MNSLEQQVLASTTQAKNEGKSLRTPAGGMFSAIALIVIIALVASTCFMGIRCGGALAIIAGAFLIALATLPAKRSGY